MRRILFKKITAILLSLLILISSASGCGGKANDVAGTGAPILTSEPMDDPAGSTAVADIEEAPPDNDWQFDTPENHGVDGAILERFHDAIKEIEMYSVVIVKDGYIIDEYYKQDYDERSVFRLNSCTKSFTSALIGITLEKGLLDSVDTKLTEFFPQLADSDSAYKKEITIAHLLEHTSGIRWPESGGPMFRNFVESENWVDFVLSQPMAAKPGSRFNYSTGGSHLLSAIIEQAAGQALMILPWNISSNPLVWRASSGELTRRVVRTAETVSP
ncbi:MAG: serine hydrolase [Clostridia bacterium]|nr:serine hydrolase [Clostridia bacterium]